MAEFDAILEHIEGEEGDGAGYDLLELNAGDAHGRGVVGVVSAAGASAEQRLQCAVERAYQVLDVQGRGHVGVEALAQGFEMLGLHFSHADAEELMRDFDRDSSGSLELPEFAAMITARLRQPPLLDFNVRQYCSTPWFLLDSIPSGTRSVSFRAHHISVRASQSICNIAALATASSVSIEVQRAIHLLVKTGPFAFTNLSIFVAEALAIFVSSSCIRLARGNSGPSLWLCVPPVCWVIARVGVMLRRRRAGCSMYVLGNPATTRMHPAKGDFPVPLCDANNVVDAYLHAKGVRNTDPTQTYEKSTRGFGVCRSKGPCGGYNRLTIGETHFLIEKLSGGGASTRADSGHWLASTQQLAGVIGVITWVHLRKQGKDLLVHLSVLLATAVATGLVTFVVAVFLPKCSDVDTCEQHAVVVGSSSDGFTSLSPRCEPACMFHNCSALSAQCKDEPPPCFSFGDGTCDEPVVCPAGSDFGDCNSVLLAVNMSGTVAEWLHAFGLEANVASAVEDFVEQAAVQGVSWLQTVDSVQLLEHFSDVNATAYDSLQASLQELKAAPQTVEGWLTQLGLQEQSAAVEAFLASAAEDMYISAEDTAAVLLGEMDSLRAVDVETMLLSLDLNNATKDRLRGELATLQAGPKTVEQWLVAHGLSEHTVLIETYLKDTARSLTNIQSILPEDFDQMTDVLGFDVNAKEKFESARFALQQTVASGYVPSDLLKDPLVVGAAMLASTTQWLASLQSKVCPFQSDGVCDEPSRCPVTTDAADCEPQYRDKHTMDAYVAFLRRKATPKLGSIAAAISHSYRTACPLVRPAEMCGGCTGDMACATDTVGYPTDASLCREVRKTKRLHEIADWCDLNIYRDPWLIRRIIHGDRLPCECMVWWQHLLPDWALWLALWGALWSMFSFFLSVKWWTRARAKLQLGVIGIETDTVDNPAKISVLKETMQEIAPLILTRKLGRPLRSDVLKSWARDTISGNEKLTLSRDFLKLEAVNKLPLCCKCCSTTHTHDEYLVLLKDIQFIETGTDTDSSLRAFGRLCLMVGLGLHLSIFMETFLVQYNARQDNDTSTVGMGTKLGTLALSVVLFVVCYWGAGRLKKDFIHIGVFPNEASRGARNPRPGKSPFFLRLGLACLSDANKLEPFKEIVQLIRSATTESRQLDHKEDTSKTSEGSTAGQPPVHLAHMAHHHNSAFFALQWAVRLHNTVRRDPSTHQSADSALAPIQKHEEHAVANWIRAREAATMQVKLTEIDSYLDEIIELATGATNPVEEHRRTPLNEALEHWVAVVGEAKAAEKEYHREALARHWEEYRDRKRQDDAKRAMRDNELKLVEDQQMHIKYYAMKSNDSFVRSETLLKLGGRVKPRWEARRVELTQDGVSWSSLRHFSGLEVGDIESVATDADIEGKPSFTIQSKVKDDKRYRLIASSIADRDGWVASVAAMIKGDLKETRHGTLLKLDGRKQNHWEQRVFSVRPSGVVWGAKHKQKNTLHAHEMLAAEDDSAHESSERMPSFGFMIKTSVKDGKVYRFRAYNQMSCAQWVESLNSVISALEIYKDGELQKLGGRGKNKYSACRLQVTNKGISWAGVSSKGILPEEISSVHPGADIGGKPSLAVQTTVKKQKQYVLIAPSVVDRDGWVVSIQAIIDNEFTTNLERRQTLMKQFGRDKDRWEERTFAVSVTGLSWSPREFNNICIQPPDILSVQPVSTTPGYGIELHTTVKDKKKYVLYTDSDEERTKWIESFQQVMGIVSRKVTDRKIKFDLRMLNTREHALEIQGTDVKLDFISQSGDEVVAAGDSNTSEADRLLQLALLKCFATFDTNKNGRLSLEELWDALYTLGLRPTHDELAWMISEHATCDDGSLSENEFTDMMHQYIDAGSHPQLQYTGNSWCPMNIFSLDFDFLPWGKKQTEFKAGQIDVNSNEGLGGLSGMTSQHSLSFESEKTRWLHMEGNPAPAWKLNAYFAEALTVYSLPWEGIFGDGTDATWILALAWWVVRAFYFFLRRRGIGQMYTLGNPTDSTDDRFAVPIHMLDATTDAFLHLKGISPLDRSDSATKTFPGLGFLPVCCGCYAEHSVTIGERHFKMSRASNSRSSLSRGCSRTEHFCGLIEDANWVGISKQGKACSRLLATIYQACISVFWLTLLIVTQTYGSTCRATLSMTAANWQNVGAVGRLEWCEQFASYDAGAKPGQPCVCWRSGIDGWPQASADAELCNPILDPGDYDAALAADDDAWCRQWSVADGMDSVWIMQSDQPCECMWWFQRFQWRLLGFIDAILLGAMTIGILYVWILVTPIWFELGIFGVDNRIREHLAAVRISSHNRTKLPLIFLQRKLGRAILTDSSAPATARTPSSAAAGGSGDAGEDVELANPGGDVLYRWEWKPLLYRCTNGVREELTLHRDLLHLHARSGTPVCFCSCHGMNDWCLKLPIDVDDYYVLLRDITFIEAITVRSSVMVKLLCNVTLLAVIATLITAGMLAVSCSEDTGDKNGSAPAAGNSIAEEDAEGEICLSMLSGRPTAVVVTLALVLWLLGWILTGKLRHPYIHIGVLPGGGRRGRANPLGGNSPFYMRLPGKYAQGFEKLAAVIRAAQLESLQHDLVASLHGTDAHTQGRRRLRTTFNDQTASHIAGGGSTAASPITAAPAAASGVGPVAVRRFQLQHANATQSAAEQDAAQMAAEMAMLRFGVKGTLGVDVDTIEAQSEGVDTNLTADKVVREEIEAKMITDTNQTLASAAVSGIPGLLQAGATQAANLAAQAGTAMGHAKMGTALAIQATKPVFNGAKAFARTLF